MKKNKNKNILLVFIVIMLVIMIYYFSQNKTHKKDILIKDHKNIVGYYADYTYNITSPKEAPWEYVTTMIYSFFEVEENGKIKPVDENIAYNVEVDDTKGVLNSFIKEHEKHQDVKAVLAIGGWGRSNNFSAVTTNKKTREIFINEIYDFLKKNKFNGVDLDWEYAGIKREANGDDYGTPNGSVNDIENYVLLVKEMKEKFKNEFSISVATPGGIKTAELLNLKKMNEYVDYFNVMAYDMHGSWDELTNTNAPLFENKLEKKSYNINDLINYYQKNVDKNKIILGIPFYGHIYEGVENNNNGLYQEFEKYGGVLTIRRLYTMKNFQKYFDEQSKSTYYYNKEEKIFFGLEDELSLKAKIDYSKKNDLGGLFVWEVSQDIYNNDAYYLKFILDELTKNKN